MAVIADIMSLLFDGRPFEDVLEGISPSFFVFLIRCTSNNYGSIV